MSKKDNELLGMSISHFLYYVVEKFFESNDINQSKMFEEILTNISKDKNLKSLSKMISPDILQFNLILFKETDRGAALMAASYLEELLEKLLIKFFINDNGLTNKLLNGYGGLSSFSSKIDLAFLLGLISKKTQNNLHLIRKIRNEFAHSADFIGFSKSSINNRCNELKCDNWQENNSSKDIFISVVFILSGLINSKTIEEDKRKKKTSEELDFQNLLPDFEEKFSEEIQNYLEKQI